LNESLDRYQVDPRATRGDRTGRYARNYVRFPWFLRSLVLGDSLSRAITGRPTCRIKDSLVEAFDSVQAPAERWGTAEEIEVEEFRFRMSTARVVAAPVRPGW
jgi:hypothetical protein